MRAVGIEVDMLPSPETEQDRLWSIFWSVYDSEIRKFFGIFRPLLDQQFLQMAFHKYQYAKEHHPDFVSKLAKLNSILTDYYGLMRSNDL